MLPTLGNRQEGIEFNCQRVMKPCVCSGRNERRRYGTDDEASCFFEVGIVNFCKGI